jgi:plasmid replication initiation protein
VEIYREDPLFELNKFRSQLGIGVNEYTRMEAFKRRVLDIAIDQINEFSDINLKYEQHKKGRSISGFSFSFKQKKSTHEHIESKRDPNTLDAFSKMTDAQRHLFSNKLSELPEMSKYSQEQKAISSLPYALLKCFKTLLDLKNYILIFKKLGLKLPKL